jgi:hypothetical protein
MDYTLTRHQALRFSSDNLNYCLTGKNKSKHLRLKMYNSRAQTNRDMHDALKIISDMVGGGYRPRSIVAGFLAADNLRYLAEEENIHVAQEWGPSKRTAEWVLKTDLRNLLPL